MFGGGAFAQQAPATQQPPAPAANAATSATIGALMDKANLMVKHGVPVRTVDAWVKGQAAKLQGVQEPQPKPIPPPPTWNAYAVAAWRDAQTNDDSGSAAAPSLNAYVQASVTAQSAPPQPQSRSPATGSSTQGVAPASSSAVVSMVSTANGRH